MISTSTFPKINIPSADLPSFIFEHARQNTVYGQDPKLVAIVGKAESLSFADFEAQTEAFASGLQNRLGLQRGDTVAVVLPNCPEYPIVALGTQMAGGIVTTANPAYTARELAHQLDVTQPKTVVTSQATLSVVKQALGIAKVAIPASNILTTDGQQYSVRSVFSSQPFARVRLQTAAEADTTPAFIVFSSGTSGKPKGVVLSHKNMIANVMQFLAIERCDAALMRAIRHKYQRRWLQVLPMFHIYGLLISNACILSGGVMVIMERFDFTDFCALIQRHCIDTVFVAPPVILALTKSPVVKRFDLSSLVLLNSGAAPLGKELQSEAAQTLGVYITQGYGMSETSPIVTRSLCDDSAPGSAGRLCPETEAVFLDDNGSPVAPGQVGELCVRGPQVMLGYLNNEAATAEALDADGFLHTGDIGYLDAAGNFYVTDRKKELIKFKGFQIPPAELEGLLIDHPAVVDAAVIPVYDKSRVSEIPKAFVVVRPDRKRPGIEDEIAQWIAARVADYKRLRGGVELIEAIPKSATGKILRRVLRDLVKERQKQAKI